MNFNNTHPELKDGEMFLGNVTKSFYHKIGWETKRMGTTPYTTNGEVLLQISPRILYPVFVQKKEYDNR